MASEEVKEAYKRRKELIEPFFGIIKEQMGIRRWLLRGHSNVRDEANTLAVAFNLRTLHSIWRSWTEEKRRELVTTIKEIGKALFGLLAEKHSGLNKLAPRDIKVGAVRRNPGRVLNRVFNQRDVACSLFNPTLIIRFLIVSCAA